MNCFWTRTETGKHHVGSRGRAGREGLVEGGEGQAGWRRQEREICTKKLTGKIETKLGNLLKLG